jgi:hypothetical protein
MSVFDGLGVVISSSFVHDTIMVQVRIYSTAKNIFFIFFELKIRHELGCPITKSDFCLSLKPFIGCALFYFSGSEVC